VHKGTKEAAYSYFKSMELVEQAVKDRVSLTCQVTKREYPILTMLGSSASVNTKTRNVSGILVEIE